MKRTIEVAPYDPGWVREFEREAAQWRDVLGDEIVAVHHVGSTAIPGLAAKPIIDLLVVVRNIERVDDLDAEMTARGYLPRGEYGIPGRRYFIKGTEIHRTHHIHVFGIGNPDIPRHLEFRDYVIAHSEVAREYGRLKEELAAAHPHDIDAYIAGKDGFIKDVQARAHAWAQEGRGG